VVEEIHKMVMFFFVVERHHFVPMLQRLGELAQPEIQGAKTGVSRDQQARVASRLCRVEHLLRPGERMSTSTAA
jgi:hypothetical protein